MNKVQSEEEAQGVWLHTLVVHLQVWILSSKKRTRGTTTRGSKLLRRRSHISYTIRILTKGLFGLAYLSLSINISTHNAVWESLLKQLMACF